MDVRRLIDSIARAEGELAGARFVAPCVAGGGVRTKVAGLVYAFAPEPADFEGWGVFEPIDAKTARIVEEADLPLVDRYLALLRAPMRFVLAHRLGGRTWAAYPANASDARQRGARPGARGSSARPSLVRLVGEEAGAFEVVLARTDGAAWWFEAVDRRADPRLAEALRAAAREGVPAETIRAAGMTPEMRTAYGLSTERVREYRERTERARAEQRLAEALRLGGGKFLGYRARDDFWVVEWTTSDGARQTSIVTKDDLTVVSSGICLSGMDRDFDLQSLVGVIEQEDEW